jgi:hypothetical protein
LHIPPVLHEGFATHDVFLRGKPSGTFSGGRWNGPFTSLGVATVAVLLLEEAEETSACMIRENSP